MSTPLANKNIAILATDGFEEVELAEPRKALEKAGATTFLIAPHSGTLKAWDRDSWGNEYEVDQILEHAKVEEYDGLLLPGGVMNPDQLRMNEAAVGWVTSFFNTQKVVAAICHAPQLLIEIRKLKDRKLTSFPSLKTDLTNAGAIWVDEEVVVDGQLITSRNPSDIPAFNKQIIEEMSK